MSIIREISEASMTPEKKETAKYDLFAYYVGRPLSYVLTVPFIYLGVSPNVVSVISIIPIIIGIIIAVFSRTNASMFYCWLCFFLWNLLDGVDGNIARYTKKTSKIGGVYDAMSGYAATAATFLCWGIAAENRAGFFQSELLSYYHIIIIMGSLSSIFTLFPRLVMQKIRSEIGGIDGKSVRTASVGRIIMFNLTSVSGLIQLLMLGCVPTNYYDLFTLVYFFINLAIMVSTIISCFKNVQT